MGRMSEARKRARQKAAGAGPSSSEPPPGGERPEAASRVEAPGRPTAPSAPAAGAPEVGFAAAAARAVAPSRIALPSSGLAQDILGREGEATANAAAPLTLETAAPAAPGAGARSHSLSFFSAPAREERAAVEATEHLATFLLEREEYGVDVRVVQEIRRVGEITQVPRAPEFVRGVMNLRGRVIPVIDLKRKLGIGEVAPGRAARIVVVRLQERVLGLLVDGASQVLKVPVSVVEAPPEEVVERGGDYIRGVAKLERRLIILVDLQKVLARELGEAAETGPRVSG